MPSDFGEMWRRDWLSSLHVALEKTAVPRFDGSLLQGRKGRVDRPETFTFLGFTHYLRKSLSGYIHVARKPSVKTRERFLREVATWAIRGSWPCWPHWCCFTHALDGFDNRQLVRLVRRFWNQPYSSRQATYDLRRLRRKAMIMRLPHSHRYQLTPFGRRVAVLFTKAHGRVLAPAFALLDPLLPPDLAKRSSLAAAWRQLDLTLNTFLERQLIAA